MNIRRELKRVGAGKGRTRTNIHELIGGFIRMTGLALVHSPSLTMQLGCNGHAA
jgi:hypothetical protein